MVQQLASAEQPRVALFFASKSMRPGTMNEIGVTAATQSQCDWLIA